MGDGVRFDRIGGAGEDEQVVVRSEEQLGGGRVDLASRQLSKIVLGLEGERPAQEPGRACRVPRAEPQDALVEQIGRASCRERVFRTV